MDGLEDCPADGKTPAPPAPVEPVRVEMTLQLNMNMYWDGEPPLESFETLKGRLNVRYIVELFEADVIGGALTPTALLNRFTATENEYDYKGIYIMVKDSMWLPKKKIIAAGWADFVDRGQTDDKYYDTADLTHVTISANYPHNGYKAEKDAFSGNATTDLSTYSDGESLTMSVPMKRPFAAYEIIATDYEEYSRRVMKEVSPQLTTPLLLSKAQYMLYFPVGYRPPSGKPEDFKAGIGYSMYAISFDDEADGDLEALLATDCIFVDGTTAYDLDLTLYTDGNKPLGMVSDKRVHLQQNRVTRIRDTYLTHLADGGGAGIDDAFGDEDVITIKSD
jgi:hypothetical protein